MSKFRSGDKVQLQSGGPEMTVDGNYDEENDNYYCSWFSGTEIKHEYFTEPALKKYEPTEPTAANLSNLF